MSEFLMACIVGSLLLIAYAIARVGCREKMARKPHRVRYGSREHREHREESDESHE